MFPKKETSLTYLTKAMNLDELYKVRMRLGKLLHSAFTILTKEHGFTGVTIVDQASPGKVCDALAANDGSSKYVRGAITEVQNHPPRISNISSMIGSTRQFLDAFALPSQLIIGSHHSKDGSSEGNNGRIEFFIVNNGERQPALYEYLLQDSHLARQEHAAVVLLIHTANWIEKSYPGVLDRAQITSVIVDKENLKVEQAVEIAKKNSDFWIRISKKLMELPELKLSVGESFTFGKLASLLTSQADSANLLELAYGWYDPKFKQVLKVPAEMLTDDRIADPDTMITASRGLFAICSQNVKITIGTSGRANNWEDGKADYFSVAMTARCRDQFRSRSIKFEVDSTKTEPKDRTRREITRELGVTASLLLLSEALLNADSLRHEIETYILQFGRITERLNPQI